MKNQNGLSLVELMISITLGLVLMAGVVQVFVSSKTVFTAQQGMSRVQETGRLAMEFIGRDLRIGGNFGCANLHDSSDASRLNYDDTNVPGLPAGLHQNFTEGVKGYTNTDPVVAASLTGNFALVNPSDILVIKGANEQGMPVIQGNAPSNTANTVLGFTPSTSLVNGSVEGFSVGTVGVISNCEKGRFFRVTGLALAGNQVTLTHATWAVIPNAVTDIYYSSGNIFPVHTIVYFVATRNGATIPSLWQRTDNDPAVELLQGVENMSLTYACAACTNNPGVYTSAATVSAADWSFVSSVHVELLVRGLDQNTNDEVQPYQFAGQTVTPTDRVLRQVFDGTFVVRSRFH